MRCNNGSNSCSGPIFRTSSSDGFFLQMETQKVFYFLRIDGKLAKERCAYKSKLSVTNVNRGRKSRATLRALDSCSTSFAIRFSFVQGDPVFNAPTVRRKHAIIGKHSKVHICIYFRKSCLFLGVSSGSFLHQCDVASEAKIARNIRRARRTY